MNLDWNKEEFLHLISKRFMGKNNSHLESLVSNHIHKLFLLLKLTQEFCKKYHVKLCAAKTKL